MSNFQKRIKMKNIKINDKVWVVTGEPSHEKEGNFVGKVLLIDEGKCFVRKMNGGELPPFSGEYDIDDLIPLIPCPINDCADLQTDWITDEFLVNGSCSGNTFLGWISKCSGSDILYPVKCDVNIGHNTMVVKPLDCPMPTIIASIEMLNDLFNCDPNNEIVAEYSVVDKALTVSFYYLDNQE